MLNETEIKFNQIKLGDKLGEGGFGVVYKATYLEANVAVKKLKAESLTEQVKEEFLKETDMMRQLKHPHIVQFYGVSTSPYLMVMEYLPKGSLFHLIHSKEDITWSQRYQIGLDIGKGIYFLHEQKIIHRDLKSLNVLLDNQYHAKLGDFGLAKLKSETSTTNKKSSSVPGTTRWKAPELFKRGNIATTASDIYAYGIILWEMTARQIPYQEESDDQTVISWIKEGEQEKIPDGPQSYNEAIQKSWALMPSKRPSAIEIMTLLKEGQTTLVESISNDDKTISQVLSGPNYILDIPTTFSEQPSLSEAPLIHSALKASQSPLKLAENEETVDTIPETLVLENLKTITEKEIENLLKNQVMFEVKETSNEEIEKLAPVLQHNKTLISLSISNFYTKNTVLGEKAIACLAKSLHNHPTLEYLDLSSNEIGPPEMEHIVNLLKNQRKINLLDLGRNKISGQTITLLVDGLINHQIQLKMLDLRFNLLGNEGAKSIARLIESNVAPWYIDMSGNHITSTGIQEVVNATKNNATLIELHVTGLKSDASFKEGITEATKMFFSKGLFNTLEDVQRAVKESNKAEESQIELIKKQTQLNFEKLKLSLKAFFLSAISTKRKYQIFIKQYEQAKKAITYDSKKSLLSILYSKDKKFTENLINQIRNTLEGKQLLTSSTDTIHNFYQSIHANENSMSHKTVQGKKI